MIGLQRTVPLERPYPVTVKGDGCPFPHWPSEFPSFEYATVLLNVKVPVAEKIPLGVALVRMPDVLRLALSVNVSHVFCPKATWKAPQPISAAVKNNRIVILVVFSAELGMFFV
jgi:hypothetical protein